MKFMARRVALLWVAYACGAMGTVSARAHDRADVPRDRWDRSVRSAAGTALEYTSQAFEPRVPETRPFDPAQVPEARPSEDEAPLLTLQPLWWRHVYGTGIGHAGLAVADLNGDGQNEIVAASSSAGGFWANDSWIVVRESATGGAYELVWRSPTTGSALTRLRVAQLDADATPEVVAAVGSQVLVYDGATLAPQQTLATPAGSISGLALANADADPALEFVLCGGGMLYVYDMNGALGYSVAVPCQDLAVGQVDTDPAPEIVIGDGEQPGYVIDGVTRAVEWTNPFGFGIHVRLGDLDNDGRDEVVAGSAWYQIRVFDVDLRSLTASITVDLDLDALQVVDVEGDGPLEIVYGDGQWGDVYVHDGTTRALKWRIANPEHGVTDVAVGDADGDGVRELLWGAGYSSTGEDHLYTADTLTRVIEWQSVDVNGPFMALEPARAVGTARRAVLAASFESDSGYGDGLYFFHYAANGGTFYQSPPLTGSNWTGLTRLRAAQLDADAQVEVLVATSNTYTGTLICRDSLTHLEQWRAQIPDGLTIASLAVGDVDQDGSLEAVVGVEVQHTGAPGVFVYVFDATTGVQEWRSPSLASGFVDLEWLRLAQVDADPQSEIVVGATNGQIYVLDRLAQTTQSLGAQQVRALDTPDLDGDGRAELFVAAGSTLRRIDPGSGAVLQTLFVDGAPIDALAVADFDGDGTADYVTAAANVVRVRSGATSAVLWTSAPLAPTSSVVGGRDSLVAADVDGRPGPELVVNLGHAGFVVLGTTP